MSRLSVTLQECVMVLKQGSSVLRAFPLEGLVVWKPAVTGTLWQGVPGVLYFLSVPRVIRCKQVSNVYCMTLLCLGACSVTCGGAGLFLLCVCERKRQRDRERERTKGSQLKQLGAGLCSGVIFHVTSAELSLWRRSPGLGAPRKIWQCLGELKCSQ